MGISEEAPDMSVQEGVVFLLSGGNCDHPDFVQMDKLYSN